ncbi:NACHT domain-containing protein [Nostoc parmelioides]|uniref:NACHT domain-containing protein n=1 Tax=Nostoc parmelioides FACHB-3921 TaxID=2692909 RepID=A0ABR8BN88_9NOSO|nr:NACHT domain-containing protein [Nostoc parmelioides]MBD2254759.1 NACHT domain-containing protein [Nostoc parmelioides FACHB-3921]
MNQPKSPDDNQASSPEPGIRQESNNSTFGAGQQAAIGTGNIQNQGNNNWLGNTLNFFFGQQTTTPVGNPARPKNERILLAAVKEEVTARLRQSLHNAVLINLGKESQSQQVKRPWDAEIKIGLKPAEPLSDTTTILEIFDFQENAGKLLILGAPGAGKTTTQLELAQLLVSRAEEQPDYPVPVLFNLSSWKDDRQSIADWLVAELKSKYGVPKKLGQELVNNQQFLPLLDGLDELEPQRQELCVQVINQFIAGENRPLYLVVCSRNEEYNNYSTQLQLNGAIYLQPLTNNQICDYLTSINYIELWSTISSDIDLLELVKTPLLLSITVLASQEISVEEWQRLNSTENRLQYLLDAYVGRMLTRTLNSRAYLKIKPPHARQTRMWLTWLAQQMQQESKTEFLIEEIQPYWLENTILKKKYKLLLSLISGLFFARSVTPLFGFFEIFYALLIGFLFCGFLSILVSESIVIREDIYVQKNLINILINLLFFWIFVSIFGVYWALSVGFIIAFFGKETKTVEINKKSPNQGIKSSAINAVTITLLIGLMGSTGLTIVFLLLGIYPFTNLLDAVLFLIVTIGGYLSIGVPFGIMFGGFACIQHFTLRLILYRNGYIPWNYARFLDYSTERLFLQRVGGRYRFIHKLLQDHFAQMEFRRD